MKHDVFVRNSGPTRTWRMYESAVTPTRSKQLCDYLENGGHKVLIVRHAKTLGKFVYETADTQA